MGMLVDLELEVGTATALPCRAGQGFFHSTLTHRRLALLIAALAIVLTLPSLRVGLLLDDYHCKLLMQGTDLRVQLLKSPMDMFRLVSGDPRRTAELMDYGLLPWWTYAGIKAAFWRPVASLTHWLDYLLWPNAPVLMHVQSVLWYGLLAGAVTLLYRGILGLTVTAGLAAVLYCVDVTHGTPVGFLANRNAILAMLFGVLALLAHQRWRGGWRAGAVVAPAMLLLSLLSKEEGIATCAFLFAYALVLDETPWRQRLASLIPCATVVILWRGCWSYLGYGVSSMGSYVDPVGEPVRFLAAVVQNAPILLLGQLTGPPSDTSMLLEGARQARFHLIACGVLVCMGIVWLPLLIRDRVARFWGLAMVLSLVPISTTFLSDRMLLFVGLSAMGLIAQFLVFVMTDAPGRPKRLAWRIPAWGLAGLLILIHLVAAPPVLALRAAIPMGPDWLMERLCPSQPLDRGIEKQDLVIVNPPAAFCMIEAPLIWASAGEPMPRHIRVLGSSLFRPMEVQRRDARTLVVRPGPGFLAWKADRLWRSEVCGFTLGEQIRLTGMTVEVTALTVDKMPAEAAFEFAVPLEDSSLRWVQWVGGRLVPFPLPAIGQSVRLPSYWRDILIES